MKKILVIGMAVVLFAAAICGGFAIFGNDQSFEGNKNYTEFTFDGGVTKLVD